MLKFRVYDEGEPAVRWRPRDARLVGADDIGVRGTVSYAQGLLTADKSAVGPAALALPVQLEGVGELILQTCLLPERDEPYLLSVELARHRVMRCLSKQEDWALFDLGDDHPAIRRFHAARKRFIEALNHMDDPPEADRLARRSLVMGIDASEEMALAHAHALLQRRRETGQLNNRNIFGCGVGLRQHNDERVASALLANFDYLRLPTPWRELEPAEGEYDWRQLDAWCEWAFRNRMPIVAGPLVSFTPDVIPDWLYIWEHDYDTVRDLLYEHIERVVTRYRNVVSLWNVLSGIHVNSHFSFNFEQLMDLTRMAILLVKKVHPAARTLIEITQPFGEYYASNQRSIPPIMYAEMVLQAGVPFDGFGLKLLMGDGGEGRATRDLMQVSALLDRFHGLGKPVHLTAAAVPSAPPPARPGEKGGNGEAGDKAEKSGKATPETPHSGGYWRKPWSKVVQAHWLEAFYNITLSKPFVESVAWLDLADHERSELSHSGLINGEFKPKGAFRRLTNLRRSFHEEGSDESAA